MFLIKYDLKQFFSSYKQFLISVICIFLFCVGMFVVSKNLMEQNRLISPFKVAIVDKDNSFETNLLFTNLKEIKGLKNAVTFIKTDEEKAKKMLESKEVSSYAIIPKNFSKDVKSGENGSFYVVSEGGINSFLFELFIKTNVDILSAAQGGVYVVLDSVKNDKELYNKAFMEINTNFLSLYSSRSKMIEVNDLINDSLINPFLFLLLAIVMFFSIFNIPFVSKCFVGFDSFFVKKLNNMGISKLKLMWFHFVSGFVIHFVMFMTVILAICIVENKMIVLVGLKFLYICLVLSALSAVSILALFSVKSTDKNSIALAYRKGN